jgi:hypothetical protein
MQTGDGRRMLGQDPLRLQPFELLAGRRAPDRWVIDLTSNSGVLLKPTDYHTIDHLEDRLYVPVEYMPLFEN